jgi:predicted metalloprotease with PDZ domain
VTAAREGRPRARGPRFAGALVAAAALTTCAPRVPAPVRGAYTYVLTPPLAGSWTLEVDATFENAPGARLVASDPESLRDVAFAGASVPLARLGDAWIAPACRARCTVRYAIDLEALAEGCHRMDCARRVGDAVIGQASTFMLRPEPMGDAVVRVRVEGPGAGRFATGLRREGTREDGVEGRYVFTTPEMGEASFTAIGDVRRRTLHVGGARLDLALLGAPLAMGDEGIARFVSESATCVASVLGRFPVDATAFVVPVPDASSVVFGRVMSLAGASVALLVGDATPASSVHGEWVVVHELFHLGTPSFVGEGHWLEEGLATYYEPIARERAGWMTEAALWTHFAREMTRGLRSPGDPQGLEDRDDIDSTYWGGALFALLADVNLRVSSGGARSLDDVLRAVLAREGDGTHASRVATFLRDGDDATGSHELSAAYASWAVRGENPDLGDLWRKLGVTGLDALRSGSQASGSQAEVVLRDDAPWAAVRRGISGRDRP